MKQTPEQNKASNPQVSARVSANAGTGKTHVLVNRFLRLLLTGAHPNKILCLTYTKAAAAEMSSRITDKLKNWVLAKDKDLHEELQNLLDRKADEKEILRARQLFTISLQSMPPPRIQTIHSFCQEILSRFPVEAKVPIKFSVIDELTSSEILAQAKQILLSEMQDQESLKTAIELIASNSSETTFDNIIEEIRNNRNKFKKIVYKFQDNRDYVQYIYNNLGVSSDISGKDIEADILNFDQNFVADLLEGYENSKNPRDHATAQELRAIIEQGDALGYAGIFLTNDNNPTVMRRIARKDILKNSEGLEQAILQEQERVDELVDSMQSLQVAQFTEAVLEVVYGFIKIYENIKEKNAYLDYEDLIFYTEKLLQEGDAAAWVLFKLDGGVEHILVDEAQDTSPEQWGIINAITDEFFDGVGAVDENRTIFIVGDEKQSIYSFQGADPASFGAISKEMATKSAHIEKKWHEVPLVKSFRSVGAVLNFVDAVFAEEKLRSSVSFNDEEIKHEIHRIGEGGLVELWPLEEQKEKEKFPAWETPLVVFEGNDEQTMLAKKIAKNIRKWLDEGREIAALGRAVRPSDIIILLRKRSFADKIIRELKNKNIKVAGSDRLKIAEHIAVMDLVALGKFLLLPSDDLSLACALKSPLFGVTENDLFELCYDRGRDSMLNRIKNNSKYKELYQELEFLLNKTDLVSPYELYSIILDQNKGRQKFLSRLGNEANDPLNEFLQLTLDFEKSHNNSLQEFLHWMDSGETQIKRDLEESTDQVRVMTVHASKGLQAPIVILPDTTSTTSSDDKSGNIIMWEGEGKFYSAASAKAHNKRLKAMKEQKAAQDHDEYLRLLYVALTRAGDEIYICGTKGKGKIPEDCWYSILQPKLEEIGEKVGDILRFEQPQEKEIEAKDEKLVSLQHEKLPAYLATIANAEKLETKKEKADIADFEAIKHGLKVHKFLEFLEIEKGEDIYQKALAYIGDEEKAKTLAKIFKNQEIFEIFSCEAIPEASFAGVVDGEFIDARVDRLIVKDDEVEVIEFKTAGKIYEKIPTSYMQQMKRYDKLVRDVYPDKKIALKILWVNEGRLQDVALDGAS